MTALLLVILSTAFAPPPGYTVTEEDVDGCTLFLGAEDGEGVRPMRAECLWPDVTLETFKARMADWAGHAGIFTTVAESEVLREEGGRALVRQRHTTRGISDREVLLWMKHETVEGYDRYGWTRATDEPLNPASGHVACQRSDGYWQGRAEGGGVRVVYELAYDPGGSVPGFIVRWFQTSGLETTVREARAGLR